MLVIAEPMEAEQQQVVIAIEIDARRHPEPYAMTAILNTIGQSEPPSNMRGANGAQSPEPSSPHGRCRITSLILARFMCKCR